MSGHVTATFNATSILIDGFVDGLVANYRRMYGGQAPENANTLQAAAVMAMEIIANSDALYHNVEHSMMVTLVGQEIIRGKYLSEGSVGPADWTHFIVSLLCHDIGYVRNICPGDRGDIAVINEKGETVEVPLGATDAFLTPHHVERGKMFVRRRFKDHAAIDADVVAANIEHTRFPVPSQDDSTEDADYPGLVRAADLIGQLADPDYLRKLAALFYEFEETGQNAAIGYQSPEDLRENYPDFFWNMVNQHIGAGLAYLRVTREGRQWEAGLYSHVFSEEHRAAAP